MDKKKKRSSGKIANPLSAGVYKRFHRSDTLIYEYSTIAMNGDESSGLYPNPGIISRRQVRITAGRGYSWQEIAAEVEKLRLSIDQKNPILTTCMVDKEEFVVALSLSGFIRAAEQLPAYGQCPYEALIGLLAKDLVTSRDFECYNAGIEFSEDNLQYHDFYPKK